MAVTNIKQVNQGSTAVITWNSTLTYSFVALDGVLFVRTTENRVVVPRNGWTDLQILDDNSADYDWESNLAGSDPRRIQITWNSLATVSTDVKYYRVYVDNNLAGGEIPEDGSSTYSFTTASLTDGEHSITVKGVDNAGNVSAFSDFDFDIIGPPQPVSDITVTQAGSPSQITISWTGSSTY